MTDVQVSCTSFLTVCHGYNYRHRTKARSQPQLLECGQANFFGGGGRKEQKWGSFLRYYAHRKMIAIENVVC